MECKDQCFRRLEQLGVSSLAYKRGFLQHSYEGTLSVKDQIIIGFHFVTAAVHPSTGYHVCRMLASAPTIMAAIE